MNTEFLKTIQIWTRKNITIDIHNLSSYNLIDFTFLHNQLISDVLTEVSCNILWYTNVISRFTFLEMNEKWIVNRKWELNYETKWNVYDADNFDNKIFGRECQMLARWEEWRTKRDEYSSNTRRVLFIRISFHDIVCVCCVRNYMHTAGR